MPLTCLIAAHDPWFIQLLRIYSEESGFRVVQVYEGQDVLPMIQLENPAAILMQADLPGKLRGSEVLRSIKSNPATCHIPVFLFAWLGHGAEDWSSGSLEGATAYLQEPVTYEVFQDALKKAGILSSAHKLEENPTGCDANRRGLSADQ